jgi:hypothetical protein
MAHSNLRMGHSSCSDLDHVDQLRNQISHGNSSEAPQRRLCITSDLMFTRRRSATGAVAVVDERKATALSQSRFPELVTMLTQSTSEPTIRDFLPKVGRDLP